MARWQLDTNPLDPDLFPSEQGPPRELFELWREIDPVHCNTAIAMKDSSPAAVRMTLEQEHV